MCINKEMMLAVKKAVRCFGGQAALARVIRVSPSAINQWTKGVRPLPAEQVLPICRAVAGEVTPFELRPDLYPDPEWRPSFRENDTSRQESAGARGVTQ